MEGNMKRIISIVAIIVILFLISACGPQAGQSTKISEGSSFTVYFIDVGQADSALIVCDGETMLIDGGNTADSDLIYTFLKNHGVSHLDYIVATHAHEDHVGGLAGALNFATVDIALCPVKEYSSKAFGNFVKYLGEQGKSITVPKHGDTFKLGSADVKVVGPINPSDEPNNTSIVLHNHIRRDDLPAYRRRGTDRRSRHS